MIPDKELTLGSIIESSGGIHVSAYIANSRDKKDLDQQISRCLAEVDHVIAPLGKESVRKRMISNLGAIRKSIPSVVASGESIGIFINESAFKALRIPMGVESSCHIATTFHVKPLLQWTQEDRDFLYVEFNGGTAEIYRGNQSRMRKIESIQVDEQSPGSPRQFLLDGTSNTLRRLTMEEFIASRVVTCYQNLTGGFRPIVFVRGEEAIAEKVVEKLSLRSIDAMPIRGASKSEGASEAYLQMRALVRKECVLSLETALRDFHFRENTIEFEDDIFRIAKAAAVGRVKRLLIASDSRKHGKINSCAMTRAPNLAGESPVSKGVTTML